MSINRSHDIEIGEDSPAPQCDSLIKLIQNIEHRGDQFCSIEFSPPFSDSLDDLSKIVLCAKQIDNACNPLYRSITCHLNDKNKHDPPNLRLANAICRKHTTLLHVAAGNLSKAELKHVLDLAKSSGIRSILALRGAILNKEPNEIDFPHALNVVRYIRENYGTHFTVCVAGYPAKHPQAQTYEQDLLHLRDKVEAGADFVITQVILEAEVFIKFVKDCRNVGIHVPIIPGIMPVPTYASLHRMASVCHFPIPPIILQDLEAIKLNDEAVRTYFVDLVVRITKAIFSSKTSSGVHLYSLNSEVMVLDILQQLGFSCQKTVSNTPVEVGKKEIPR